MKNIIILSALVLGFAGMSFAQTTTTEPKATDITIQQASDAAQVVVVEQMPTIESEVAVKVPEKKCDGKKACCKAKEAAAGEKKCAGHSEANATEAGTTGEVKKCEKKCAGHSEASAVETTNTEASATKKKCDSKKDCCKNKKS